MIQRKIILLSIILVVAEKAVEASTPSQNVQKRTDGFNVGEDAYTPSGVDDIQDYSSIGHQSNLGSFSDHSALANSQLLNAGGSGGNSFDFGYNSPAASSGYNFGNTGAISYSNTNSHHVNTGDLSSETKGQVTNFNLDHAGGDSADFTGALKGYTNTYNQASYNGAGTGNQAGFGSIYNTQTAGNYGGNFGSSSLTSTGPNTFPSNNFNSGGGGGYKPSSSGLLTVSSNYKPGGSAITNGFKPLYNNGGVGGYKTLGIGSTQLSASYKTQDYSSPTFGRPSNVGAVSFPQAPSEDDQQENGNIYGNGGVLDYSSIKGLSPNIESHKFSPSLDVDDNFKYSFGGFNKGAIASGAIAGGNIYNTKYLTKKPSPPQHSSPAVYHQQFKQPLQLNYGSSQSHYKPKLPSTFNSYSNSQFKPLSSSINESAYKPSYKHTSSKGQHYSSNPYSKRPSIQSYGKPPAYRPHLKVVNTNGNYHRRY